MTYFLIIIFFILFITLFMFIQCLGIRFGIVVSFAVISIALIFGIGSSFYTLNDSGDKRVYYGSMSSGAITYIEYVPASQWWGYQYYPSKYAIKIRSLEPINDAGEYLFQTITIPVSICKEEYKVGDIFNFDDYDLDEKEQIGIECSYIDQCDSIPNTVTATISDGIQDTLR